MSTLAEHILTTWDARAVTDDGLRFSIRFTEFADTTARLDFTQVEADLPAPQRDELVRDRYNALRAALYEKHGLR